MNNRIDTEPQLVKARAQKLYPCPEGTTYNIQGKEYPVKGYYKIGRDFFPLVDIKMMSDYKWQHDALMSRLKNRELYADHENVDEVIEQLKQWLIENQHKAQPGDPIYMPEKAAV